MSIDSIKFNTFASADISNPQTTTFEQVEKIYQKIDAKLRKEIADVELRGEEVSIGILLFRKLRARKQHTPKSLMDLLRLYNPHANCRQPSLTFSSEMGNELLRYAHRLTKDEVEKIANQFLRGFGEASTDVVQRLFSSGKIRRVQGSSETDLFLAFLRGNGFQETVARICANDPLEPMIDQVPQASNSK